MPLGWAILLIILALLGGAVADEQMIRTMMLSMGQKPSERKINQMVNQMKGQAKKKK